MSQQLNFLDALIETEPPTLPSPVALQDQTQEVALTRPSSPFSKRPEKEKFENSKIFIKKFDETFAIAALNSFTESQKKMGLTARQLEARMEYLWVKWRDTVIGDIVDGIYASGFLKVCIRNSAKLFLAIEKLPSSVADPLYWTYEPNSEDWVASAFAALIINSIEGTDRMPWLTATGDPLEHFLRNRHMLRGGSWLR